MVKHSFIAASGLTEEQVKMARLVTNIWKPYDYYKDIPDTLSCHVHEKEDHDNLLIDISKDRSSFWLHLLKLFGIDYQRNQKWTWKVKAELVMVKEVDDETTIIRSLGTDKEIQKWIQDTIQMGREIYMIVKIVIVKNAEVSVKESSDTLTTAQAGIPVSEITSHGTSLALPLDGMIALGVGIGGDTGAIREGNRDFKVHGKRVFGVEYRKINARKGKKNGEKELDSGETRWAWVAGGTRRSTTAHVASEDEDETVVTVSIGDIVDAADVLYSDTDSTGDSDDEKGIKSLIFGDAELIF